MQITHVDVKKINSSDPKLKGFASVVIDDCFAICNIRIIEKKDKLALAMPNRKIKNTNPEIEAEYIYQDVAHPINAETRAMFEDAILSEYNKIDGE